MARWGLHYFCIVEERHIPLQFSAAMPYEQMSKEAILSTAWIGYGDDGILRIRILEDAVVDIEGIKLQYKTIERLTGLKKVPVLLDARANFSSTRDTYEFLAQHASHRIATAVLTRNPFSKAVVNTYITVFRPVSPYKLFTDEQKAIEWLMQMVKNEQAGK
jgi:hypothetical protein